MAVSVLSNFDGEFRIPVFAEKSPCNITPKFPTWAFCFRERCFRVELDIDGMRVLDAVVDIYDLKHGITISQFLATFTLIGEDSRLCMLTLSSTSPNIPDAMLSKMLEPGLMVHYRNLLPSVGSDPRDCIGRAMAEEINHRLQRVSKFPAHILIEAVYWVPISWEAAFLELPRQHMDAVRITLLSPNWDLVEHTHDLERRQRVVQPYANASQTRVVLCEPYRVHPERIVFTNTEGMPSATPESKSELPPEIDMPDTGIPEQSETPEEATEMDPETSGTHRQRMKARHTDVIVRCVCVKSMSERTLVTDEVYDFSELQQTQLAKSHVAVSMRIVFATTGNVSG
jgi:hypothetical protein